MEAWGFREKLKVIVLHHPDDDNNNKEDNNEEEDNDKEEDKKEKWKHYVLIPDTFHVLVECNLVCKRVSKCIAQE